MVNFKTLPKLTCQNLMVLRLKSELDVIGTNDHGAMLDANIIGAELAAMSPLGLRRRRRGQGA
jgi:hypothetical protein